MGIPVENVERRSALRHHSVLAAKKNLGSRKNIAEGEVRGSGLWIIFSCALGLLEDTIRE